MTTKSDALPAVPPPSPCSDFLDWSAKAGYLTCTSDITLALWDAWQAGKQAAERQSAVMEKALIGIAGLPSCLWDETTTAAFARTAENALSNPRNAKSEIEQDHDNWRAIGKKVCPVCGEDISIPNH